MRHRVGLGGLSAVAVLLAACSEPEAQRCVPGRSEACVDVSGCSGAQVCNPDGASFGACVCAASSDAGSDGGTPTPVDHLSVVSDWVLPLTSLEAETTGVEVDGDSGNGVDNQLARALAALTPLNEALRDALQARTDDGSSIVLLNVQLDDVGAKSAKVFTYVGSNPEPLACLDEMDTVCRGHLTGEAQFTATPTLRGSPALAGSVEAQTIQAGPGSWELPLMLGNVELNLEIERARFAAQMPDGSAPSGRLGGALPMAVVQQTLVPAITDFARDLIARDCTSSEPPACGCASGSFGQAVLAQLDTSPLDCALSGEELVDGSGGFEPDVDLDGDGVDDALSFGLGFEAVGARYTLP